MRIIQRFGRIDRIGSKNDYIQLVNFWPDVTLDEYIDLKAKVETRMKISVMTSTGDDNLLSPEEKGDLEYRKAQLKRLQEEVVDIEEMSTGISIMDLGLNEFRLDLLEYIKTHPDLDKTPFGLHAVAQATDDAPAGVVFVLKNRSDSVNIDNQNRLHPFYMVYITNDGDVVCDHLSPKDMLDKMRYICRSKIEPIPELYKEFNRETKDGKNMAEMSALLGQAINSIINVKEESDVDSFLAGDSVSFSANEIKGLDDFELICFLVVKDSEELKNKKNYRLVVAGSRDFNDYTMLCSTLDEVIGALKAEYNVTIVSGTANGADKLGERYADKHGLRIERHPANWGYYGRGAGPVRNAEMVEAADGVVVFWNGESAGAKNIIDCAKAEGNLIKVIKYE